MKTIKSLLLLAILIFPTNNLLSHKDAPKNDLFDDNRRFPFTDKAIKEKKESTEKAEENKNTATKTTQTNKDTEEEKIQKLQIHLAVLRSKL